MSADARAWSGSKACDQCNVRTDHRAGAPGKEVVMGVLSCGSGTNPSRIVQAGSIPDTSRTTFHTEIKVAVDTDSTIYMDTHGGYGGHNHGDMLKTLRSLFVR